MDDLAKNMILLFAIFGGLLGMIVFQGQMEYQDGLKQCKATLSQYGYSFVNYQLAAWTHQETCLGIKDGQVTNFG